MNRRDIVIGVIILAIIAGIIYWVRRPEETPIAVPTPTTEEKLEEKFKTNIPEDVDKAELGDITGGDASAIATRDFVEDTFTATILADLPEPESGKFYQGWLVDDQGDYISMGVLRAAKGGYLLDFSSSTDYSDYNEVVVTEEQRQDATPETHILEGNFQE